MKKARIAVVALAVLMLFAAVSCKEPHVHSYGDPQVKDGKVVQVCECGDVKEVEGAVAVGTEDALKKAIEDGVANIYLSSDIDVSDTIIVGGEKKIVLNLNGKSLFNTKDIWYQESGVKNSWSLISVRDKASLTIGGNGSLKAKENDVYAADVYDVGAKLIIENGKFVGNSHCIYVCEGELVVNGGEFSIQQKSGNPDPYGYVLNCYDSSYADKTAKIVVSGGTFANFNPADCTAEGADTNFLAEDYKTTSKDVDGITWWTVEKN